MVSADEDSDASLALLSQGTQFVPQEGDEDNLWKVIEITGETKKTYRVRWDGIDPATNKPWAQSWVPKRDCTNDLVVAWKLQKARKRHEVEQKNAQKGKGKAPAAERTSRSSKSTTNSSTTTTRARSGPSTADATPSNSRPTANPFTSRASSSGPSKRLIVEIKRKRAVGISGNDSPYRRLKYEPLEFHPRKKRKVDSDDDFNDSGDTDSGPPLQDDGNDEHSDVDRFPQAKSKSVATKKRALKTSEGTTRSIARQPKMRPIVPMKTVPLQSANNWSFFRTKRKKRPQTIADEDDPFEEDERWSNSNADEGDIDPGHESETSSPHAGNGSEEVSSDPGQSVGHANNFGSSLAGNPSRGRATFAKKTASPSTNRLGKAPTAASKKITPLSPKGHAVVAKKLAPPGFSPVGTFQTSPTTGRNKRPRQASDDSSELEVTELRPAATTSKDTGPVKRGRSFKTALSKDTRATDNRTNVTNSPVLSQGISSVVLSPHAKARLAQFDHDMKLLNDEFMRGSLPPIETLSAPSSSQQTDQSRSVINNGRNHTKSLRAKVLSSHSTRANKASSSRMPPIDEVPSSTLDQSFVPETEPELSDSGGYLYSPVKNIAEITASSPPPFVSRTKAESSKVAFRRRSSEPPPSPTLLHRESLQISSPPKSKSLGRLPVISPSVFHQISEIIPSTASAIDSRIDSVREFDKNPFTPSPIEHFSSPEKDKRSQDSHPSSSLTDPSTSSRLFKARDGVIDRHRLTKKFPMKPAKKKSLSQLLEAQKNLKWEQERQTARIASTRREPHSNVAKPRHLDDVVEDSPEIAEDYIDLTVDSAYDNSMTAEDTPGNVEDNNTPAHIRLRREEEESTQDAMMMYASEGVDIDMMPTDEPPSQTNEQLVENTDEIEISTTTAVPPDGDIAPEGVAANSLNEVNGTRESEPNEAISSKQNDIRSASDDPGQADHSTIQQNTEVTETSPRASAPPPVLASAFEEPQRQLAALQETLEAETRARKSAESDRDLFREQYARASSFVSSVRDENAELVKRTEIAEKRAVDGVALVRATFAERVRVLEAEVTKARAEVRLHVERDRRTGNDIRRRAGEEPELRARCERLERKVEQLEYDKEALEMDLAELEAEKENWASETEVQKQLKPETSSDAQAEVDDEMKVETCELPSVGWTEETQEDGDEMVYRCQWRTDGTELCNWFFSDIEDLQRHLFLAGHIQETCI